MKNNLYQLNFNKKITSWDDGLPIGNGKMGALIFNNNPLMIALDRIDLWDERSNPITEEKGFNYPHLIKLVNSNKEKDWNEHNRLFDECYNHSFPTKLTAGSLVIDFKNKSEDISYHLDMSNGLLDIINGNNKINLFMSQTDFVGVAKIKGAFSLNINLPAFIKNDLFYPDGIIKNENNFTYYVQNTLSEFSYGIFLYKQKINENEIVIYLTITHNKNDIDFIDTAKKELLDAAKQGYETLLNKNIKFWKKYYHQSSCHLYNNLFDSNYIKAEYLFASTSRRGYFPTPLQGVWTKCDGSLPPWKGDYHFDTNVELSYCAYLRSNHLDEGLALIDYLWSLRKEYVNFAKKFYRVKGLLIPACSTLSGKPLGGWGQYSLSPTMTIWTIKIFDDHYIYTDNIKFLKTRAYPIFKKVGEAFINLLIEKNGKYYLPLSTSPEIYDASKKAYFEPNTNFDLSLLIYLFKTLLRYTKILNIDGSVYQKYLSALDNIAIKDDIVLLAKDHQLSVSHRHFSHLMCFYPLHLINYEKQPIVYEKTLKDLEKLTTMEWVGFSFIMSSWMYSMAKNGEMSYKRLKEFCTSFVNENGFHLNGDFKCHGLSHYTYRPFTLEANFAYIDAIQQTLIQDFNGYIDLFPALAKSIKKASFKNFRAINGLFISSTYERGTIKKLLIKSNKEQEIEIRFKSMKKTLLLNKGVNNIIL